MKRFYTLLAASAVMLTAAALTPGARYAPQAKAGASYRHIAPQSHRELPAAKAQAREAAAEPGAPGYMYAPQGEAQLYTLEASRFEAGWEGLTYLHDIFAGEIVWGEGGKAYIRDIVSAFPLGYYVEGTVVDNQIIVQLPQLCYYEAYDDGSVDALYVSKMELYSYEKEGELYIGYTNVAEEDNYVVYDIADDGITLALNDGSPLATTPPQYIIGVAWDTTPGENGWEGFGDSYQTFAPFTDKKVEVPEGVELVDWAMASGNYTSMVKVGFDGDDVYICDLIDMVEGVAIKGAINGDKIKFESPQFVGTYSGKFLYFLAILWEDEDFMFYDLIDEVEMDYDAENQVIAVNNPLIDLAFSVTTDEAYPIDYVENPTFWYQDPEAVNAAPQNPFVGYFEELEYRDYLGIDEGYIEWIIPAVNVNGSILDTKEMYYHFLLNGEAITLTMDEYPMFEDDFYDIPYDYDDGWDLQVFGESHYFSFRWKDVQSFGLQSFYIGTNGEVYASDIVTYVPESSGVKDIDNAGKAVKAVEFFNLQGQKVSNPSNGIFIMRTTLEDGTSAVRKIAK